MSPICHLLDAENCRKDVVTLQEIDRVSDSLRQIWAIGFMKSENAKIKSMTERMFSTVREDALLYGPDMIARNCNLPPMHEGRLTADKKIMANLHSKAPLAPFP